MDEKDRLSLLMTALQMFAPAMTDQQVKVAIAAIFEAMGLVLPDATSEAGSSIQVVGG